MAYVFYSDLYRLPLPEGHRFPADKYRCLRDAIERNQIVPAEALCPGIPATYEQLARVHTREYLDSIETGTIDPKAMRRIGFPWSPELVVRCKHSVGASLMAAKSAHEQGLGIHLAGGTHHAFADRGEGYCVFNDVAVAIGELRTTLVSPRFLIIDCDVHQGNGTAAIFARDEEVFTFSIHGAHNFPLVKEQSDLDIALEDGTTDDEYLVQLSVGLKESFRLAKPDFIFYLAGADPFEKDRFGKMKLTKPGLAARDEMVLNACQQRRLPVTIVMAGGYAPDVNDIVQIQSRTIEIAQRLCFRSK